MKVKENEEINNRSRKINEENVFIVIGQILTIVGAILWCFTIVGLIWGIPMIIGSMKRLFRQKEITISHIVISIIFYWLIGGIVTLIGAAMEKRI